MSQTRLAISVDDLTAARLRGFEEGKQSVQWLHYEAVAMARALNPREKEVLILLGKGLPREEVMSALGIARTTVDTLRERGLKCLDVGTNAEAAVILTKAGLL